MSDQETYRYTNKYVGCENERANRSCLGIGRYRYANDIRNGFIINLDPSTIELTSHTGQAGTGVLSAHDASQSNSHSKQTDTSARLDDSTHLLLEEHSLVVRSELLLRVGGGEEGEKGHEGGEDDDSLADHCCEMVLVES